MLLLVSGERGTLAESLAALLSQLPASDLGQGPLTAGTGRRGRGREALSLRGHTSFSFPLPNEGCVVNHGAFSLYPSLPYL